MKKKAITLILAISLMGTVLTSCGGSNVEPENEAPVAAEDAAEEETPEAAAEEAEDVEAEESETEADYINLKMTEYSADGSLKTITKYIYDEAGNIEKAIVYGADASLESSTEYERDADGSVMKSVTYDADGKITESTEWKKENNNCVESITYDADGNMIESTKNGSDDNGDYSGWTSYDADGNITESYLSENEYDDNRNQIKNTTTQMSDFGNGLETYLMVSESEYDDNNRRIKEIGYGIDGSTVNSIIEFAYDSAGNCITETKCDADGSVTSTVNREYDANGNVIKETDTNADGSGYSLTEYEYDSRGNLVKQSGESNYDYYTASSLSEYEYDADGRQVKHSYYADGRLESMNCMECDDHGNVIREIFYSTDETWARITEYEYMTLQDYLATKESIDQEGVEAVNTDPIEKILADSGALNAEEAAAAAANAAVPEITSLPIEEATVRIETGGGFDMSGSGSSIWCQTYDSGSKMTGGHIGWNGELQDTVAESTDAYGVTYRSYAFKNLDPAGNVQSAKDVLADYMETNPNSRFTALVKESGSEIVIVTYPALFPDGIEGCIKYPDINLSAYDYFFVDGKLHILCSDNTFDWLEGTPRPDIYISEFLNAAFDSLSSMLR